MLCRCVLMERNPKGNADRGLITLGKPGINGAADPCRVIVNASIRAATPADLPALLELMNEVGLRPNTAPEHLEWKYWRPRADHPGPRSFVMTRGSQILAHTAIVPGVCLAGTDSIRTLHLIDWAARPGA